MDNRAVRSSRMGVRSDANAMCEFSIEAQPIWKKTIKKQQYRAVFSSEVSKYSDTGGENANGRLMNTKMLPIMITKQTNY